MRLIKLREDETAKLIKMSDRAHVVNLHFGPGWVALDPEESPWAAKLIEEWRGRDPEGL